MSVGSHACLICVAARLSEQGKLTEEQLRGLLIAHREMHEMDDVIKRAYTVPVKRGDSDGVG